MHAYMIMVCRYARLGGSLDPHDPITAHLTPDILGQVINAGVLLALLVAYVIHINVASQVGLRCAPQRIVGMAHHSGASNCLPALKSIWAHVARVLLRH
jgi:hypothetical protein